jgi:hypothetical protein
VLVWERLGESMRGWVSLREVGLVCERLGDSLRDWVSL